MKYLSLYISSIIVFFSFIQCSKNTEPILAEPSNIDFGNPYSIVAPANLNIIIKSDTLYTKIGMSGGGPTNDFEIKYSDQSYISIIWLKNHAPISLYQGYFEYWVKYRLPKEISLKGMGILFLGPSNVRVLIN
jgi:hypothetical protein